MFDEILTWLPFAGPLVLAVVIVMLLGRLRGRKESKINWSKYSVRESVLTHAEIRFFNVLAEVVGTRYQIMLKPRLLDVFEISGGDGYQAAKNRIAQKHIDFLLYEPGEFQPVLGIELDDSSHDRKDRKERDEFVDSLFAHAGLGILHVPTARAYQAVDLADRIKAVLRSNGGM